MISSVTRALVGAFILHVLLLGNFALAQAPSPEAIAAAKELLETMHVNDQYNAIMPTIVKTLKPAIVQGRADVERQYDVLAPAIVDAFRERISEMIEAAALVYARNFSIDELHAANDFYKTPVGQRFREKIPAVTAEMIATGQKLGQSIGGDVQKRIIEELRKKGVNL